MSSVYDSFTDQAQEFGVQFIFLIFADENFAGAKWASEHPALRDAMYPALHVRRKTPMRMNDLKTRRSFTDVGNNFKITSKDCQLYHWQSSRSS